MGIADGVEVIFTHEGVQVFYKHGREHREDGPAKIWPNGYCEWWFKGMLHRTDGPAIEWSDGTVSWACYSDICSFDEWCQKTKKTNDELVYLKLAYSGRFEEK